MSTDEATTPPADTFEDLEECFRPVAVKHGRALFATVMNLGMAQQALGVAGAVMEKHRSRGGVNALMQLGATINQLSNALGSMQGWTPKLMAQVDKDIQEAFRARERAPILLIH